MKLRRVLFVPADAGDDEKVGVLSRCWARRCEHASDGRVRQ